MSLNNLRLPDMLIADLYKNCLLPVSDDVIVHCYEPTLLKNDSIQFLGKHLKKISVFVQYASEIYLPEQQLNFLANVLKACNLNLADIAIINIENQLVSIEMVKSQLGSKRIILFDIDPSLLHPNSVVPLFSIKEIRDIAVLKVPAIDVINQQNEEGRLLKSKFWLCLKELFNVS